MMQHGFSINIGAVGVRPDGVDGKSEKQPAWETPARSVSRASEFALAGPVRPANAGTRHHHHRTAPLPTRRLRSRSPPVISPYPPLQRSSTSSSRPASPLFLYLSSHKKAKMHSALRTSLARGAAVSTGSRTLFPYDMDLRHTAGAGKGPR